MHVVKNEIQTITHVRFTLLDYHILKNWSKQFFKFNFRG